MLKILILMFVIFPALGEMAVREHAFKHGMTKK